MRGCFVALVIEIFGLRRVQLQTRRWTAQAIVAGVLVAAICSLLPQTVAADELSGFVQMTCAPEIGYFSIRRFQVANLPKNGRYLTEGLIPGQSAVEALQKKYGVYDSRSLKNHPYECSIPAFKLTPGWGAGEMTGFSIRVSGHLDVNSNATTYQSIADNAEVFLNGKSVALIGLNPHGFMLGVSSLAISQENPGLNLSKCSVAPHSIDGSNLECSNSFQSPSQLR